MPLLSVHGLFASLAILLISLIPSNSGIVFASNSTEKVEIITLEAIDSRDMFGRSRVCDACATAQTFFLSVTIKNNESQLQPFVTIIEIRDQEGITQYLQFQLGKLDSNAISNVGISWTPSRAGEFELRSFIVSDLIHSEVLSTIHSTIVKVS